MVTKAQRHVGTLPDCSTAVVHIDDEGVRLEIDRLLEHPRDMFDGQEMPDRLVVGITQRSVVTMTGAYRIRRSASFVAAHEQYQANLTFIGPTEFVEGGAVTALTFRPSNEFLSVMYRGHRINRQLNGDTLDLSKFEEVGFGGRRYQVDVIDNDRCEAFSADTGKVKVSGHVMISTNSNMHGVSTSEERQVRILYNEAVPIDTALGDMLTICDFMSLMVGEVVSPRSVRGVTDDAADRWGRPPTFDIYARWRHPGREIDPQYGRRCLSSPMFDPSVYSNALACWIERQDDWRQSYALGTTCLENQREISRRRFLDAAAWFESIPSFYESKRDKIDRETILAAASAASDAFTAAGADVPPSRAQALLSAVNAASLGRRITEAMARVRSHLGDEALPERLNKLAPQLPRIRGRFAHGEDAFLSDIGHLVHDAILLFEVLAGVLTLEGLGILISPDALDHPLRAALLELQQFGGEPEQPATSN